MRTSPFGEPSASRWSEPDGGTAGALRTGIRARIPLKPQVIKDSEVPVHQLAQNSHNGRSSVGRTRRASPYVCRRFVGLNRFIFDFWSKLARRMILDPRLTPALFMISSRRRLLPESRSRFNPPGDLLPGAFLFSTMRKLEVVSKGRRIRTPHTLSSLTQMRALIEP